MNKILSCLFTFVLVDYAWIYFRANSIEDAIFINKQIFTANVLQYYNLIFNKGMYKLGIDETSFKITVIFIAILLLVDVISQKS